MNDNSKALEQLNQLAKALPKENLDLVAEVVRTTLNWAGIDLDSILAAKREEGYRVESQIEDLEEQVAALRQQIAEREAQIRVLEREHGQTKGIIEALDRKKEAMNRTRQASPGTASSAPDVRAASPVVKSPQASTPPSGIVSGMINPDRTPPPQTPFHFPPRPDPNNVAPAPRETPAPSGR